MGFRGLRVWALGLIGLAVPRSLGSSCLEAKQSNDLGLLEAKLDAASTNMEPSKSLILSYCQYQVQLEAIQGGHKSPFGSLIV